MEFEPLVSFVTILHPAFLDVGRLKSTHRATEPRVAILRRENGEKVAGTLMFGLHVLPIAYLPTKYWGKRGVV